MRESMKAALAAMALGLAVTWTVTPSSAAAASQSAAGKAAVSKKAAGKAVAGKALAAKAQAGKKAASKAAPKKAAVQPNPSPGVAQMADWVVASGDSGGLPFMIIDKVTAAVFVFEGDGQLRGSAPALLGLARGDLSAPGVGDRKLAAIRPRERTTPAGRFVAAYGWAYGHKKVLWVDYATAISLHPVITTNPKEQRIRRLNSASPKDNRITYGCINVSGGFYENIVRRTFTGTRGVVYILPETESLDTVFPTFAATQPRTVATAQPATDLGIIELHAATDEASDVALVDARREEAEPPSEFEPQPETGPGFDPTLGPPAETAAEPTAGEPRPPFAWGRWR